jgi:uncharacterized protein (DUF885 family)
VSTGPDGASAAEQLKARLFLRVVEDDPEEASTLGVDASTRPDLPDPSGRWRDWSPAAIADEASWYTDFLPEVEAWAPATVDESLDREAMLRLVKWRIRAWCDLEMHLGHVEASLMPNALVQFQQVHGCDVCERVRSMPALVAQLDENWRLALARGRLPDVSVLTEAVERDLPEIARIYGASDPRAGQAWTDHCARLRTEVLPRSTDAYAIGEDEYRWRLQHMLGIDDSPRSLVDRATEQLTRVQERLLKLARRMSANALPDLAAAAAFVAEVQAPTLDDPMSGYAAILECAAAFAATEELVDIPDDLALELVPASPGLPMAANWPAPLLRREGRGHFVVQVDHSVHSRAWAADLAIHEGIPGHYLQSAIWQRRFHDEPAPVRFFHLADFVAAAHQYWAPMVNVEGWAVYAEELMRSAGFFAEDEEELCVWVSHAVRWARVVVDASLHTRRMETADAERFLAEQTCVPAALAAGEVLRYKRIPMQAVTYAMGWQRIEALALASPDSLMEFNRAFLARGPVFPPNQPIP